MVKKGSLAAVMFVLCASGCASQKLAAPQAAEEPGMFLVRGGRFTMGQDKGGINERPAHTVEVDAFAMDRTEVSAADFAEFLNAVNNQDDVYLYFTPDEYATVVAATALDGDRDTRFSARQGYERYPANNISWKGADAYCRWRGKRLPTEAEWEKAARGTDKRRFPWGKRKPGASLAQFDQVWQQKQFDVFVPVDALTEGASPYGMFNMAGNVLEWVNDWYRQNLCDFCNPGGETNLGLILQLTRQEADAPESVVAGDDKVEEGEQVHGKRQRQIPPRNNPSGPAAGSFKVLRGGSWPDRQDDDIATTHRFWLDPSQRFPFTGFRCSKGSPSAP